MSSSAGGEHNKNREVIHIALHGFVFVFLGENENWGLYLFWSLYFFLMKLFFTENKQQFFFQFFIDKKLFCVVIEKNVVFFYFLLTYN